MNDATLENLNRDLSDAFLTPLQTQPDQSLTADAPLPQSPEGQETLSAVAETLFWALSMVMGWAQFSSKLTQPYTTASTINLICT